MLLWFAHSSEVPIYRQLVTQVILAVLSDELRPGDRLPSTRELARRFTLHPNTVSAGYRQLENKGWTERRRGTGITIRAHVELPSTPEQRIDHHIAGFFRAAREMGLPAAAFRVRGLEWLAAPAPDHFVLIDPDPGLREILPTELREATTWAVSEASVEECDRPETLAGAIPLCRPSQAKPVRAALPKGVELVILPLALGIACNVEGLAISLMLPVWRKDLSTLRVAWQLRGQMVGSIGKVPHIVLRRTIAVGCVVVVAMCLLGAMPAFAIEPGRVDYVGGTAAVALDTIGTLDTTSPTTLVLEYKGPDGTTGQIDIKYEQFARLSIATM